MRYNKTAQRVKINLQLYFVVLYSTNIIYNIFWYFYYIETDMLNLIRWHESLTFILDGFWIVKVLNYCANNYKLSMNGNSSIKQTMPQN